MFSKDGNSAPHKPLLLLLTLSEFYSKAKTEWRYEEIESQMKELLEQFGPVSRNYRPEYPFVRLVNDGFWEVRTDSIIDSKKDYSGTSLKSLNATGNFSAEAREILLREKKHIPELMYSILDNNFPETIHQDITEAIGFRESELSIRRTIQRDSSFREKILMAYGYKCAVCGLGARLGDSLVALEAAHIKWHHAGGPDIVPNGIALCSLHHKLYDRGAFAISKDHLLAASARIHNGKQLEEVLLRYQGKKINLPLNPSEIPDKEFLDWNWKNIFKTPVRYFDGGGEFDVAADIG